MVILIRKNEKGKANKTKKAAAATGDVRATVALFVFRSSFFLYLPLYTTRQILPFTLSVMYRVPSGPM
jgi:hypothetical protein